MWRVLDMVKPVRTIDEIVLVLQDLGSRPLGPAGVDQDVRGQLAAAQLATKALEESTADEGTLEAARERVKVLEDLRVPTAAEMDPLAGSLNQVARPNALPASDDPSLAPIAAQSTTAVITDALRSAVTGFGQPREAVDQRRDAHARLLGQKEALRALAETLAVQEEIEPADAAEKLRSAIDARLQAVESASAALTTSARAGTFVQPAGTTSAGSSAAARETAPSRRGRPGRRRIGIIPKPVEDDS
jgi:hypothetical protein